VYSRQLEEVNALDGERERSLPIIGTLRKSSTLDSDQERSIAIVFGKLQTNH